MSISAASNVRKYFILIAILAALGWVFVFIRHSPKENDEDLYQIFHENHHTRLVSIDFNGRHGSVEWNIHLTNQAELEFFSNAFAKCTTNLGNPGSIAFEANIYFSNRSHVRTSIFLSSDLSYLIINKVRLVQILDPVIYRVPLDRPLPADVLGFINHLTNAITGTETN